RAEGNHFDRIPRNPVAPQPPNSVPGSHVPQLHGTVAAARGQDFPVRAEGYAPDVVTVPPQDGALLRGPRGRSGRTRAAENQPCLKATRRGEESGKGRHWASSSNNGELVASSRRAVQAFYRAGARKPVSSKRLASPAARFFQTRQEGDQVHELVF